MDCDYDPEAAAQNAPEEGGKGRKRRKRKSRFAAALSKPKPKYDPNDKNFEKYFDEYFKLDCEDIVGDIPCRFKYRKVVPNDFGLTAEEILLANERELNKWCSLKKAVQIRPDHVEKYEQIAYKKKGENINLKMKILPSLFLQEPENVDKDGNQKNEGNKNSKKVETVVTNDYDSPSKGKTDSGIAKDKEETEKENGVSLNKKRKKKKTSEVVEQNEEGNVTVETATEKTPTKKKNKKKKKAATSSDVPTETGKKLDTSTDGVTKAKKKKKKVATDNSGQDKVNKKRKRNDSESISKKAKKLKKSRSTNDVANISDARLAAYGINPKKFKNKLKYAK